MYNRSMGCSEDDCENISKSLGFCQAHYAAKRRAGLLGGKPCAHAGCPSKSYTRGLCSNHYQRMRARAGGTLERVRQPFGAWCINSKGYVVRKILIDSDGRASEFQHRVVMADKLGRDLLPHENVHHINGVRNDNRLENLELWSTHQPYGQRVDDKIDWAIELLRTYRPEVLSAAAAHVI